MRNSFKISTIAVLAALLAFPASAATINLGGDSGGGLLNLGGSGNGGGNTATVTTNGLLGTDTNNDAAATADLGGLGSGTDDPTTGNVNLGGTGGTNGNVLLDLFGSGNNPDANVTLGGGDTTAGLPAGGGMTDATLDLFGNGDGSGAGGSGGTGLGGGDGTGGSGGSGIGGVNSDGSVRIASLDTGAPGTTCFTPNATQVTKLVNRHAYAPATFAGWGGVTSVKVVDIGLCNGAGARLAEQPNIARLQGFIDSHPSLRTSIAKLGHSSSEVIGVDRNGQTLVVYVM